MLQYMCFMTAVLSQSFNLKFMNDVGGLKIEKVCKF